MLSAGGTKIHKADTNHWAGQAVVGLALQEECIALLKRLQKWTKDVFFVVFNFLYVGLANFKDINVKRPKIGCW